MKRERGLDIIRLIAILFVFGVHFFLYSNFYAGPLGGWKDFIAINLRWLFYTCVPLFMLISGYLLKNKTPNNEHYVKLLRYLFYYLIISIILLMADYFAFSKDITLFSAVRQIITFNGAKYGWYLNMYVGLYLLVPYLNVLFKNLNKEQQQKLIITLLIISSLPAAFPLRIAFITNWWIILYPITYYYIGSYIAIYKININKIKLFSIGLGVLFGQSMFTYFKSLNGPFNILFNNYAAIPTLVLSVIIFLMVYNSNYKLNTAFNKLINKVAILSLPMYLISSLFDQLMYQTSLFSFVKHNTIIYFVSSVTFVFIGSFLSSIIIDKIFSVLIMLLKNNFPKLNKFKI